MLRQFPSPLISEESEMMKITSSYQLFKMLLKARVSGSRQTNVREVLEFLLIIALNTSFPHDSKRFIVPIFNIFEKLVSYACEFMETIPVTARLG